jgi:thiol-disulfide isomerase/thioredoxin
VGQRLPELRVIALDDASKSIAMEDLNGRVVLVNLWGTWCPPCRVELPHIVELAKKYRDRPDFQLLAITCGQRIPEKIDPLREQTQGFLRQTGLDLPTYLDPDAVTRRAIIALTGRLGGLSLPMTFLIDRQGVIRNVWTGFHPSYSEEIDQSIAQLLEEKAN